MGEDKISLELTSQEAKDFLIFRQFQNKIQAIIASGIFNIRNGKAVLSFNNDGDLMNVETIIIAYQRVAKVILTEK